MNTIQASTIFGSAAVRSSTRTSRKFCCWEANDVAALIEPLMEVLEEPRCDLDASIYPPTAQAAKRRRIKIRVGFFIDPSATPNFPMFQPLLINYTCILPKYKQRTNKKAAEFSAAYKFRLLGFYLIILLRVNRRIPKAKPAQATIATKATRRTRFSL